MGAIIKEVIKKMDLFGFKLLRYCVNYTVKLSFAEFILQKLLGISLLLLPITKSRQKGKKQMAHKEVKEEE